MRDGTIASGHPTPIKSHFPDIKFERHLEAFCSTLKDHLLAMDRESNWSPEYYTELEAEVEVVSNGTAARRQKQNNLQQAIRSDRTSKSFLILGVPGAGKSVALRKLAFDMLSEAGKSGRVPIYINLREWSLDAGGRDGLGVIPTQELESFVIKSIKERGDVFTDDFVDKYFRDLWIHGRLFFIFDSFDEIPELLDADEDSEVIAALSDVISRFISSSSNSRGVLASRIFRRPTRAFLPGKILEIRPLSDVSIINALDRFKGFTSDLKTEIFSQRNDLIPIARNPFLMALLGAWVSDNGNLPVNQSQIYESYVRKRLLQCNKKMQQNGLLLSEVIEVTKKIAWFVFNSPGYGIEAPVKVIGDNIDSDKVIQVVELLSYARLARISQGEVRSFAFVHRRFMEYFVTARLLDNPQDVPVEHIPTDSRGRDALVLYAQLCDADTASKLAQMCWKEIHAGFSNSETILRGIHCLRFLVDAFCARRYVIAPFARELTEFVNDRVRAGDNILIAKLSLEATGLLSDSDSIPIIEAAITSNDKWLQETAFRACRNLPKMGNDLKEKISDYVNCIPDIAFWRMRKTLLVTLSISESLSDVRTSASRRLVNIYCSIVSFVLASILVPGVVATVLMYLVMCSFIFAIGRSINEGYDFDEGLLKRSRLLFGMSFMVFGISTAFGYDAGSGLLFLEKFGLLDSDYLVVGLVVTFLGFGFFEWFYLKRIFYKIVINKKDNFYFALMLLCAVVGALGIVFIMKFIWDNYWARMVIYGIGLLFGLMCFLVVIGGVLSLVRDFYIDYRLLRGVVFPAKIQREQLVVQLGRFKSEKYRLKFIAKIEQERVEAIGAWPSGFVFAMGKGDSITELAKLEERWLRLDR